MRRHDNRGTSTLEFAVILPLLLMLIFGTFEASLWNYNQLTITLAATSAAREGMALHYLGEPPVKSYLSVTEIKAIADNIANPATLFTFKQPDPGTTVTIIACDPTKINQTQTLVVTVEYDYYYLWLPTFLSGNYAPMKLTSTPQTRTCE